MGSMNYAKYSRSRKDFVFKFVFANPFDEIIELLEAMRRLGIKPEHECFDVGHVGSLAPLVDMGLLEAPLHADFVMGVVGGIPASARNLAAMADNLPAGKHHWGVIGIGREQWMLVAAALTLGGSVRVGLEDNFYLPDGEMARSNGELIAKARQMTEDAGRRPATVRGGASAARVSPRGRTRERLPLEGLQGPRSHPAAPRRVLLAAAGRLRRRRDQGRGHRARATTSAGRRRTTRAPTERPQRAVPVAQPRQALDPDRSEVRRRQGRAAAAGRATPTCCSSRSGRACSTASASATSACARRTRGSSTARSPATARTGPDRDRSGPRPQLPRPERDPRAERRGGRAAGVGGRRRSPTWAAAR